MRGSPIRELIPPHFRSSGAGRPPSRERRSILLRLVYAGLTGLAALSLAACAEDALPTSPSTSHNGGQAKPGQVTDLSVAAVEDSSLTLTFTEVDDGTGSPAKYDVRYDSPKLGWGSAPSVTEGSCATPVEGSEIGSTLTCTVEGLTPTTKYELALVAYRGTLDEDAVFGKISNEVSATTDSTSGSEGPGQVDECASPEPGWIWCDDFEEDRTASYFEYGDADSSFVRADGVGTDGSQGMRVQWASGQVDAGFLRVAFGETPQDYFEPVDEGTAHYREVYWRVYVRNEPDWTGGGGDKLSRATSFASSTSWAQAMVGHVWSGSSPDEDYLVVDPASGTDEEGNLVTTTYNDPDMRWLGADRGVTPLFDAEHVGEWYCVEARARLNDPDDTNGVFELWIDGELEARRTGLNWVGSFTDYGINAVFLENYWNDGAPKAQERYLDNFVVSTGRIGCGGEVTSEPAPVTSVEVSPAADTVDVGSTAQYSATVLDADGNVLSDREVTWSVVDTAVAAVDSTGLTTGESVGATSVVATADGMSDSAGVTVEDTASATSDPGQVTDLSVASVTDSSATLTFTEVDDGTGSPAKYDVRLDSPSISWGGAPSVTEGSCATPVQGSEVGATLTCTVQGLSPETAYEFQLIAYRGTLNEDAVFGKLSNVAGDTTAAAVASVEVSPAADTVAVGSTAQYGATVLDADGNVLSDREVSWSVVDTAVATVDGTGLATGESAGATSVVATADGVSGSAGLTVEDTTSTTAEPGQVTDLSVASTTDSSATVTFTEVDDGTGSPASYEIRYALNPIGWGWGDATVVTTGDCPSGFVGDGAGTTRTCTVPGLDPSTTYDVQMVAWRDDADGRVYGELSNVATGTTDSAESTTSVASVEVSPAADTVDVGSTAQYTATVLDADGNELTGETVSWSTGDVSVATVDGTGLATGEGAGSTSVTATADGVSGSAGATVEDTTSTEGSGASLVEDFTSYSDLDHFLTDPNDWYLGRKNTQQMALDRETLSPEGTPTLRYDFPTVSSCSEYSIINELDLPSVGELWVEVWAKFSANFTTVRADCSVGQYDYKFLLGSTDVSRFQVKLGTNGTEFIASGPGGATQPLYTSLLDPAPADYFDGQWHRYRMHWRINGDGTGTLRQWFDDRLLVDRTAEIDPGATGFLQLFLGSNRNSGAPEPMSLWWGPIRYWKADPGW